MTHARLQIKGTLVVVGGGRMGEAIVGGLVARNAVQPSDVTIVEPLETRRAELEAAHGVRCLAQAETAFDGAGVVLLAVKPQLIDNVIADLSGKTGSALIVSIAAGITCARLESSLPAGTAVVRVMPNTPAMVGEAMSIISAGSEAAETQVGLVRDMFAAIGKAVIVEERYQDAAMAISGAGPAYMALFIDALARAGVRQGLQRSVAQELAVQTMRGTAEMLEQTGMHPEELIDGVSSPGGATIAAIEQFEAGGLRAATFAAVDACVRRAKELGSS